MEARTVTPDTGRSVAAERARRWPRWATALGRARLLTVCGLVLGGGLIVTAGGVLGDSTYLSSALLEIGAALFLAIPLILLERLFTRRLGDVQTELKDEVQSVAENVSRAQTQIDQLGQETRSRIAAVRESDAELLDRLHTDPSERNVWNALHRAQEFAALDHAGVRVRIPKASLRMRFNATPGDAMTARPVEISVEDRDGRPASAYESWSEDESAEDALAALAGDLQRRGEYPGDERFDATEIFEALAGTLATVIRMSSNGRSGGPLGRLVELDGRWALTHHGLEHIADARRRVRTRQLLDDRANARATLVAGDEDDRELDHAIETAVQYHMGVAQRMADRRMPRAT